MTYRLNDQFGPLPGQEYDDFREALNAALLRAGQWNRPIVICNDRRSQWTAMPNQEIIPKKIK